MANWLVNKKIVTLCEHPKLKQSLNLKTNKRGMAMTTCTVFYNMKTDQGKDDPRIYFIEIFALDKTAEEFAELAKGDIVEVSGYLSEQSWYHEDWRKQRNIALS